MGDSSGGGCPTTATQRLWATVPSVAPVVAAIVGGLCFLSTWQYGFVWDDRAAVKLNADVDPDRTPWVDLWRHDFWGQDITTASSHKSFRPVSVLSYRFNYAWTRFDGWSYHAVNIALHATSAGLLTALALRLRIGRVRSLIAGLLFATHPVHVEAVACIVGRAGACACVSVFPYGVWIVFAAHRAFSASLTFAATGHPRTWWHADVLSAVFSLAGLHAYISAAHLHGTRWRWALVAVALGLMSTLSKEVGISTLAMFVAYDGLVVAHPCPCEPRCWETPCTGAEVGCRRPGRLTRWRFLGRTFGVLLHPPVLLRALVVVTTVVAFMQYRLGLHAGAPLYQWTVLENQFALMPAGLARTLSVLRSHAHYMWLMVWPATLAFDHGYAAVVPVDEQQLWDVVSAAATVGMAYGIVGLAVGSMWKRNWGVGLFCAVWAVVSFFPASNLLIFVGTEVAERLLYFPSMGLAILAARCMAPSDHTIARVLGVACGGVGAGAEGIDATVTQQACTPGVAPALGLPSAQGAESASPKGSAGDSVPNLSARGGEVSGVAAGRDVPAGVRASATAVKWRLALTAVVVLALAVRTEVRSWDWESERTLFERDLATYPDSLKALNNVGLMLLNGDADELQGAIRALRRATELHPNFTAAHFNLGLAYRNTGDDRALAHLRKAASMPNAFGSAFAYLGIQYLDMHLDSHAGGPAVDPDTGEAYLSLAKRAVERAAGFGCKLATLYMARGTVAFELREFEAAVREYQKAAGLAQAEVDAGTVVTVSVDKLYNQLGLALAKLDRHDAALQAFEAALAVEQSASVYSNMAATLLALGRGAECLEAHRRAVTLESDNPLVLTNAGYAMENLGQGAALQEALSLYERANELLPSHPQIIVNLANLKARLG